MNTFLRVKDYESGRTKLINIDHIICITDSYNGDCFIKTSDGSVVKTDETFEEVMKIINEKNSSQDTCSGCDCSEEEV